MQEVLDNPVRQGKKIESKQIGKEEIKTVFVST
jgi:hypothetical protein